MSGGETDCTVGLSSGLTSGDRAPRKTLAVKDGNGAIHAPKKGFGRSVFCLKLFTEQSYIITSFSNLSLSIVPGPMRAESEASGFDDAMRPRKGLTLRMEYLRKESLPIITKQIKVNK